MFFSIRVLARKVMPTLLFMICGAAYSAPIAGAGSSFAAPLYRAWSDSLPSQAGLSLKYRSVGSGEGQKLVMAHKMDFGASDNSLPGNILDMQGLYQFPTAIGAIVVVINVPGVGADQMRLDGSTLVALFRGDITSWNDPRIRALNPDLRLPDLDVLPVHREEGSGTSQVFSDYLRTQSPSWKPGSWGEGAEARGNDGVAASVRQSIGGIGFVEYAFARRNHLNTVKLKNHSGLFVTPETSAFKSSAYSADWQHTDHYAVSLLDASVSQSWPIMSATFVLVPVHPSDQTTASAVKAFFTYGLRHGDKALQELDYIPLPNDVKNKILAEWP
ncbi:phosphate ABC transporter substrate-binding protein PstS [Gluconobacter cerinus]|nr:phosphate ABC transporter substrate-binding protein PstS [Gluconobacter cerinus]MBS1022557.1 phosphate ABC transporter substrate-binding protein PstS [Gluconobacter cerinus]